MKAVVIAGFGGPDVLQVADVDTPVPGAGEVRVQVQAIAVARTKDVAARAGLPPFGTVITSFPHILGTEHAGVVDSVGAGVDPQLLGRRVAVSAVLSCGVCRACLQGREEACTEFRLIGVHHPGSYAQYSIAPAANLYPIPDDVTMQQAASIAANGPVARAQLEAGQVGKNSVVVVVGAAGSLGSTAVALAAHRGARVIGIDRLLARPGCLDGLPLIAALDGDAADLGEQIQTASGSWGADCVVDNLGIAKVWNAYRPHLADMGRIIVSGAIDHDALPMRLLPFYLHSQSLIGVRTGNKSQMTATWLDVSGGFRPPTSHLQRMPWLEVATAHQRVEAGTAHGQTVLDVEWPSDAVTTSHSTATT